MLDRAIITAVAAFILVLVSGVATLGWTWWWQEKVGCNARWEESIGRANAWWELKLEEERGKLLVADVKGEEVLEELALARKEHKELLAKQQESVTLPDPCSSCRVPWEWIWVRKGRSLSGNNF